MVKVEKMPFKTYVAVVKNAVGSKMYSQGFARIDGIDTDIMKDGELSCAFFVSSVLSAFNLISGIHATVESTVADLVKSGWQRVEDVQEGDVIIWHPIIFPSGEKHAHIGVATAKDSAISNDFISGTPRQHPLEVTPDGTKRRIQSVFRGRHLFDKTE